MHDWDMHERTDYAWKQNRRELDTLAIGSLRILTPIDSRLVKLHEKILRYAKGVDLLIFGVLIRRVWVSLVKYKTV